MTVANNRSVEFMHMPLGRGMATFAFYLEKGWLYVGEAFCSPKDQFSKKCGRSIATERLRNRLFHYLQIGDTASNASIRAAIKWHLANLQYSGSAALPGWAFKGATPRPIELTNDIAVAQ